MFCQRLLCTEEDFKNSLGIKEFDLFSISDNKPFIRSSISVHFIFCNSQDMQRSLPPVLIFDLLIISLRTTNEYSLGSTFQEAAK